jgi:hypothetical protein
VVGETPPEIIQGSSQDVALILTPVVASWAGSLKVGEDYFQELEVEIEDTRAERLLGKEILVVGFGGEVRWEVRGQFGEGGQG